MVYKLVIPMLCVCSTMSLYAEEIGLGDIIQQAAQDKALVKPSVKKKAVKKESRFVFKDEYHANGIGEIDKTKEKSESYSYEDKSRFKFKFNDGSQQSNLMSRYGVGGVGMGGAAGSAGQGGGGGRR